MIQNNVKKFIIKKIIIKKYSNYYKEINTFEIRLFLILSFFLFLQICFIVKSQICNIDFIEIFQFIKISHYHFFFYIYIYIA